MWTLLTCFLCGMPVPTLKNLGQHNRILSCSVSLSEKPNQTGLLLTFYFSSMMLFEVRTDHWSLAMVLGLLLHAQA